MFVPLSIPSPDVNSFDVTQWLSSIGLTFFGQWNLPIRFYALCIILGIILATWMTSRRLTKRGAEPGVVLDIIIWAVPLGFVGARVFHVLTHPGDYFYDGADLLRVFYIWEGGIALFGSLIGGAIGAWIGCRLSGIRFWTFADALAPAMLVAQAAGRLGNYFNTELFGQPTTLPWGLEVPSDNPAFPTGLADGTLFHPTFLYEIIWNLAGVAVLLLLEKRFHLQWGKVWALYLIWYGIGRTWFETIRVDPSEIFFGVRTNVWAAWAAILLGIILFIVQSRRHPGVEPSPYRPGAEWVPPTAEVESTDTYSDDELEGEEALTASENEAVEPSAKSEVGAKS
ncbi:prolipoprotein diacylglyceryl transferase [Herbiconiux daphne]|uniref:Phosphatidylglycerol--prolipoprotein diacylglyceryl transferase n=1 Tax=Herbiconiux daphne TaxID=2970914 RepID=A0ABT2GZ93_9MICO|nr:prolipoprotein diacylglyceryl transferase [Herbiconiux daphne]MCS5733284.1 prolipoprotein diacylglyceryl transferase [Herbiconiux daphne]